MSEEYKIVIHHDLKQFKAECDRLSSQGYIAVGGTTSRDDQYYQTFLLSDKPE